MLRRDEKSGTPRRTTTPSPKRDATSTSLLRVGRRGDGQHALESAPTEAVAS